MGWSFRKRISAGPFHINISKSGVGLSAGVSGARVGISPDGRANFTASIIGSGVTFRQGLSRRPRGGVAHFPYHPQCPRPREPGTLDMVLSVGSFFACFALAGLVGQVAAGVVPLFALAGFLAPFVVYYRRKVRYRAEAEEAKVAYIQHLIDRFGEDVARLMVEGGPWQGATPEMVSLMYGDPDAISTNVHKATSRQTWKYAPLDSRSFLLRIEFENGVCVGWQTA